MYTIAKERSAQIRDFHMPAYKEIPAVGLYLDQVAKYINETLSVVPNCSITNSMISNYVKKKLIDNPVKKQYYRDQIATLIFITMTKNVLSLDSVDKLLKRLKDQYDPQQAYDFFAGCFEAYLHAIFAGRKVEIKEEKDGNKTLIANIIITVVRNMYISELLNDSEQISG